MALQTIKGRTISTGQKVKVYFNLHKKLFSIQDAKTGLVIGHADSVNLEDVTFKVSEAGRKRVLREKRKNVHAFVIGHYVADKAGDEKNSAYYNPYKTANFLDTDSKPLFKANSVTCIDKQIRYA